MSDEIETRYLTTDIAGQVYLRMERGLVYLGPIDCCDDEVPTALTGDLERLKKLWLEATETGRAYEATARAADSARHSPGGW